MKSLDLEFYSDIYEKKIKMLIFFDYVERRLCWPRWLITAVDVIEQRLH